MLLAVNYHYIRNGFETPYPAFFGITPTRFREQLTELSRHGTFVSADQIHEAIIGKNSLPARSIVITFDDGLKEQYEFALPILDDMGIPAIFFVNTINLKAKVSEVHKIHLLRSVIAPHHFLNEAMRFVEQHHTTPVSLGDAQQAGKAHYLYDDEDTAALKYLLNFMLPQSMLTALCDGLFRSHFDEKKTAEQLYLSYEQLTRLLHRNMIGSHGHEHLPLGALSVEDKHDKVLKSQEILTELSGRPIHAFSYPYGSEAACEGMDILLKQHGFTYAFTMKRDVNSSLVSPFYLSRFDNNDVPGGKACKIPAGKNMFDFLIAPSA